MENIDQSNNAKTGRDQKTHILFAISISILLYGAYFYYLVKQEFLILLRKQEALESIKAIAVPGTAFLNNIGGVIIFKSSLFYLVLFGMMFLVFMLFSLLFRSPLKRAIFLSIGLLIMVILTINDRVNISFPFVICLSFASFYLLTLPYRIVFSIKEVFILLLLMIIVSVSLFHGSRNRFFLKTRDRVLFDSALGNKMISFYYTYSPLASSLISPEQGVYEGLIIHEDIKHEKFIYLGNGVFLSGKMEVKGSADFLISKQGKNLFITNRYGKRIPIESINGKEIEKAISHLFSMKGFLFLSKIGLYLFPAGLLILPLMAIKWLTKNKKVFVMSSTGIASILVLFIWYVSLTGNNPPKGDSLDSMGLSQDGLSIAYHLYGKKEIPDQYIPIVKMMVQSESLALRYWGAYLLGMVGDKKEAQSLMPLLADLHLNVRYQAAKSLFRLLKQESLRPLLFRLINDPSWYVRCKIFSIFLRAGMIPSPA